MSNEEIKRTIERAIQDAEARLSVAMRLQPEKVGDILQQIARLQRQARQRRTTARLLAPVLTPVK